MKILYVVNSFRDGGAEMGLLTLVENGFFAGHDFVLYALARDRGTVGERLLRLLGPERVRCLSDAEELRDSAVPRSVVLLAQAFRREQPEVVILSLPQANLVGRIASLVVPRAVVASFEHTVAYKRRLAHWMMAATAPIVDAVLYDHPETWRNVRPLYRRLPASAAHYVPLTLVEPVHAPARIPEGTRQLVTTMRLESGKNHPELLHAVRILLDRGYDFVLTVAGEGPMRAELERLAQELGLRGRVRFIGFVVDPWSLLLQCDTYVLSSVKEGLSRSVIEAMAAGLLVVATDVGGIREYGVDGENMIKARGTGREELATALATALDLGQEARRVQEGALRTVREKFSADVVQQHWRRAIEALATLRR